MTINHWGELVLNKDEYQILKAVLEEEGVNLRYSATDCKEYTCYIRNPWKQAGQGWGSDLVQKQAEEFFNRYKR